MSLTDILSFTGHHFIWLTAWSLSVACLYYFTDFKQFSIPWLPLSLIGTAVAFYVGFKNNQAYDRLWEGRKIWGGIVNSSRSWGSMVKHFVNNQNTTQSITQQEINALKQTIIYRHIAWVYTLRSRKFGIRLYEDEITETNLSNYLPKAELEILIDFENTATQIIDKQAEELTKLRTLNLIDDLKHMELQKNIE